MKNKPFIVTLTVIVSALCIFYLSFTYISWNIRKDAEAFAGDTDAVTASGKKQYYFDSLWNKDVVNILGASFTLKEVRQYELKLGLDLQGGMHIVLEIAPASIIKNLASNPKDPHLEQALTEVSQSNSQAGFVNSFIRAYEKSNPQGRLAELFTTAAMREEISVSSTNAEVGKALNARVNGAVERTFKILRDRIDRFGVANPNIQLLPGTDRIQIELPGVEDPERVRKLVQGMAKLEFYEVYGMEEISQTILAMDAAWMKNNRNAPVEKTVPSLAYLTDATDTTGVTTVDSMAHSPLLEKLTSNHALIYNVLDTAKINAVLKDVNVQKITPPRLKLRWAAKPEIGIDGIAYQELYPLRLSPGNQAILGGDVVVSAGQDLDEDGQPAVHMQMNTLGAKKWGKITSEHIQDRIAIVLDDYVYSAPVVQSEIPNGSSSISGNFTVDEAKDLANILEAGKLPATTNIVEEAVVGPSLGQDAITQGLLSMVAGLGLVVVFMLIYYNTSGLIANLALFLNVFFILGILVQVGAALTLPGMAGIVLTIGMSVDANVLIFERIKEELQNGQSTKAAISTGYTKAYSSIIDSNVTTFLTGAILYLFGSGGVKGFALVLMIGIACSLFTAVFVTRLIIEWRIRKSTRILKFDTFLTKRIFNFADFNFVGRRKLAYLFSAIIIGTGVAAMIIKGGIPLGIDFRGGRSYVVKFEEPKSANEVRSALSAVFPDASVEVKTFDGDDQLKITTSYLIHDHDESADKKVEDALKKGLVSINATDAEILSSAKIGPTIADDLKADSQTAVLYSLLAIFLYIVMRFRKWQFGLGAVIALFHDVLIVISIFGVANLLGLHLEIDQVFIAAVLTVIGYSINDTVVVFDRIREFASRGADLPVVFNKAINSTLSRTIITSFTVFIVVMILLLFGGEVLRGFSFALLIGVVFGTYSSIFIAAPIVLDFDKKTITKG